MIISRTCREMRACDDARVAQLVHCVVYLPYTARERALLEEQVVAVVHDEHGVLLHKVLVVRRGEVHKNLALVVHNLQIIKV